MHTSNAALFKDHNYFLKTKFIGRVLFRGTEKAFHKADFREYKYTPLTVPGWTILPTQSYSILKTIYDAVFRQKNGSQVQLSQLLGNRIIVLFQNCGSYFHKMLWDLKDINMKMKGTGDEFEVIHVHQGKWSDRVAAAMPWLIHTPFNLVWSCCSS